MLIGLSLQCMCVNESFCVTGSDDGFVRLWPLDFKHVLLEAQHDGPVTAVDISMDCLRVLAATSTVCLYGFCVEIRSLGTILFEKSHLGWGWGLIQKVVCHIMVGYPVKYGCCRLTSWSEGFMGERKWELCPPCIAIGFDRLKPLALTCYCAEFDSCSVTCSPVC